MFNYQIWLQTVLWSVLPLCLFIVFHRQLADGSYLQLSTVKLVGWKVRAMYAKRIFAW